MMGALLASGARVALTGRAGHQQVMGRHLRPVGLVQVLAGVLGVRVIGSVDVDG